MNIKQRDIIFQRWCGVFRREARDVSSLERAGERALAEYDVRSDSTLSDMIRAELQERRAELEQKRQNEQSEATSAQSQPNWRSGIPEQVATDTPQLDLSVFNSLAMSLSDALESGDNAETRTIFGKMRALQQRSPEVIPATVISEYEQRVETLRVRLQKITDEITTLTQRAVAAARDGDEQQIVRSMRRLAAIQAAHPRLLEEPGLEEIRRSVAFTAAERHEHERTTRKLLERERAIAADIKALAAAVRNFHQVACAAPDTSEAFRQAEAAYLQAVQKVQALDAAWFSDVVLELADLLAEWTTPPSGARSQIDRFLDGVTTGLKRIRKEMRKIKRQQDASEGDGGESAAS